MSDPEPTPGDSSDSRSDAEATGEQTDAEPTGEQTTAELTAEQEPTDQKPAAPTPNERQRELIESTDGTYLVDAGAGTGKTFAITRRYARIVDQPDVEPDDVLLVTFTRSAATEMRERIVEHSTYSLRELADAAIQTFHSYCSDLLDEHGHRAPTHLGLDERITGSTRVVSDELVKEARFREFFDGFRAEHPEHADVYRVLDDGSALLDVVEELAAKGVFPTSDGWYRDGAAAIDGDVEAFEALFEDANQPRNGGSKQSELREDLNGYGRNRTYLPDAPSKAELRGDGTKRVPDSTARRAFEEHREDLEDFVHDVYFEYLSFALSRNYLTFGFLQLFAYVLLCEDPQVRETAAFEYVMVDEFQDTSEIQFELALLLADGDNLCVVGDWKQSIYSFQYADVDNILAFEDRLERFATELNEALEPVGDVEGASGGGAAASGGSEAGSSGDGAESGDDDAAANGGDSATQTDGAATADHGQPVSVDPGAVERIELEENYRSTQTVLDVSEEALLAPGTRSEDVDERVLEDVVSLSSNAAFDETRIEGVQHPDVCEAVLTAVQEIVGNDEYAVEGEDGEPRAPSYGDVAVLTRTRDFGRELLSEAEQYDFPMAYDGGVELFRTDQAKLLLAWLRVLESDADRGWAVVLEEAGYALAEIRHVLEAGAYPSNLLAFRDRLAGLDAIGSVARRVFDRYGFTGEYADVILDTIQSMHDDSTLTRGDLLRLIERGIESGSTHEVSTSAGVDSVTVQTIHAAKGLEYPIVVLANVNDGAFPPRGGSAGVLRYEEPFGLRQRKLYADVEEYPHVYDNWTRDVLRHCRPDDYDEERRLLYVAITRAEQHVVFTAGAEPSTFFESLPFDERAVEPAVERVDRSRTTQTQLPFSIVPPDGPTGHTPHTLMDDAVFETDDGEAVVDGLDGDSGSEAFRGRDFGDRVHDFAEAYALGEDVAPTTEDYPDEGHVAALLDGLDGEFHVEEQAVLPLTVDGERVAVSGLVDLVHECADRVEVVDYKTDRSRRAESEYQKQLSVYYHVLREGFPEKEVTVSIFYTASGEQQAIEPLSVSELEDLVRGEL